MQIQNKVASFIVVLVGVELGEEFVEQVHGQILNLLKSKQCIDTASLDHEDVIILVPVLDVEIWAGNEIHNYRVDNLLLDHLCSRVDCL